MNAEEKLQKERRLLFLRFRTELTLTQTELAEALEYGGKNVIAAKENGRRPVTARDLLAIECLLRISDKWPVPHRG